MPNHYTVPRPRSCQACSVAKARCEPDFASTKCKRCNKQNVDCILKAPAPRKRRKETHVNDVSHLPSRLPPDENSPWAQISISSTSSHSPPSVNPTATIVEVRQGLEYYRHSLYQWFPFIQPPDLRLLITDFVKAKPFLSLTMAMLGCTKDRGRQRELAEQGRDWLASHVLQRGDKSLDILQGLLLTTHWYTFQFELPRQRNMFLHMAMSMIVDLGLFKSPFARRRIMTKEEAASAPNSSHSSVTEHTLEEKRALLGCIYLTSAVTTASLSVEVAAHFSVYAEQCYSELEHSDLISDQILAHLCHFQHMVEQFSAERSVLAKRSKIANKRKTANSTIADRYPGADGLGYVAYWNQQLTEKWNAIPDNAKTKVLLSEYCYAHVCLHDSCLETSLLASDEARLKIVYSCISALKSFNDAIIPLYEEPHTLLDIPFHSYARANHSIFVALQLCSLKCRGLSAEYVEHELNLTRLFGSVSDKAAALLESMPSSCVPVYHRRIVPMAKAIQQGIAARLGGGTSDVAMESMFEGNQDMGNFGDFEFLEQFLNTDDDLWLQRLLAVDEYQTDPLTLASLDS